jgi:hypothetical protein
MLQRFRRNVWRRSRGKLVFFRQQIGVASVPRKAKIEQDRFAGRAQQYVFRLDIEMNDLLEMR